MRFVTLLCLLALISKASSIGQDSKPVPAPFHGKISPVESLKSQMHLLPAVMERIYALNSVSESNQPEHVAQERLVSMLRLELKGLFSEQQKALAFVERMPESERPFPKQLFNEYSKRVELGWYENTLKQRLSAAQIVDLLNAERNLWNKSWKDFKTHSRVKGIPTEPGQSGLSMTELYSKKSVDSVAEKEHPTVGTSLPERTAKSGKMAEDAQKWSASMLAIAAGLVTLCGVLIFILNQKKFF